MAAAVRIGREQDRQLDREEPPERAGAERRRRPYHAPVERPPRVGKRDHHIGKDEKRLPPDHRDHAAGHPGPEEGHREAVEERDLRHQKRQVDQPFGPARPAHARAVLALEPGDGEGERQRGRRDPDDQGLLQRHAPAHRRPRPGPEAPAFGQARPGTAIARRPTRRGAPAAPARQAPSESSPRRRRARAPAPTTGRDRRGGSRPGRRRSPRVRHRTTTGSPRPRAPSAAGPPPRRAGSASCRPRRTSASSRRRASAGSTGRG